MVAAACSAGGPGAGEFPGAAAPDAIAEIEAGQRTTPLVSGPTSTGDFIVTFLARSPGGEAPRIVSDVTGWGENARTDTFDFTAGRMARVGRTDWYSLETRVAPRARVEYLVVHGRDYRLDPYNPRQERFRAGGPASEFVTPGYVPPEQFEDAPSVPAGRTTQRTVESRALGGSRRVIVYTPPGYRTDGAYSVAVFQYGVSPVQKDGGGSEPADRAADPVIEPDIAPRLLDHWIAEQAIQPIVVVFVEASRFGDERSYPAEAMCTFMTHEMLAWLGSQYAVGRSADDRAILGVSAGAKDALDAAVASPGAFGRVGLFIPGRRVGREPDIAAMVGRARQRLRVTILAGQYDQANLPTAQNLRRALTAAGHAVDYILVAEGHSRATWRNHVRDVLVSQFGPTPPTSR